MEQLQQAGADVYGGASGRRFYEAAMRAGTARQRVVWLQRFVSASVEPVQPLSACHEGCAHCCHVPLPITNLEASLLAEATSRKPARPSAHMTWHVKDMLALAGGDDAGALDQAHADHAQRNSVYSGSPCPFLDRSSSSCTVYDVRPMPCRVHLNMGDDAGPCDPQHAAGAQVPYFNAAALKALLLSAQPGAYVADIREFFPVGDPA